jgi:hypothetical protein
MPIFRIGDKLHYFAHVPKSGGSSVEYYLTARFGRLALVEPNRPETPRHLLWTVLQSNHVPLFALDPVFPRDWFASSFATVRHPLRRLVSAFFFARDVRKVIPLATDFNAWAKDALSQLSGNPFAFAGHVLPQWELVPEDSRVFRLEDGLDPVIPYLDGLAGNTDGPREMPVRNIGRWRKQTDAPPVPDERTLELVAKVYARDFQRFGYEVPTTMAAVAALPDLPTLEASGAMPVPKQRGLITRLKRDLMKRAGM